MRQSNGLVALSALAFVAAGQVVGCKAPGDDRRRSAAGSASPASATAAVVEAVPTPSPRPLRAPSALPDDRALPPPSSPLFASCSEGFSPKGDARVDAQRLGLLCGPVNGLSFIGRTVGAVDEAAQPARYEWEAEKGDCFRVVAVADAPVEELELEIIAPGRERLFGENQSRRWLLAAEDRPFCATRKGTFQARFIARTGKGAFAAEVWRGARMGTGRRH